MNDLFIKMTQMLWDGLFDEFKVLLKEHPESLCAEMVLSAVKYNYMNIDKKAFNLILFFLNYFL